MRRINDHTADLFDRSDLRPPGRQRAVLTEDERREKRRAYVRAHRAKIAKARMPTAEVLSRALLLAYVREIEDRRFVGLRTQVRRILVEAGYSEPMVDERFRRVRAWMRRNGCLTTS